MRAFAFLALASLTAAVPSSLSAQTVYPAYSIYFYSDATHSDQVGFARPMCAEWGAYSQMQWGYSTNYRDEVHTANCVDGELEWL